MKVLDQQLIDYLVKHLDYPKTSILNVVSLSEEGATIPFIARYRKERTGSLDEVAIADILSQLTKVKDLQKRKATILAAIKEDGKLTADLTQTITNCWDAKVLEDIYLPFKKKRKTKAEKARQQGLEPLARKVLSQNIHSLYKTAESYLSKEIRSVDEALEGARYIIAELVNENASCRDIVRREFSYATLTAKVVKSKIKEAAKYKDYFDFSQSIKKCPSHRVLAINRGEAEGYLRVNLDVDKDRILNNMKRYFHVADNECGDQILLAIEDSYKRLTEPSISNEVRGELKAEADKAAIEVFSRNAHQLLLAAPLGPKRILALDPGFRTGCKVVCLNETGDLLQKHTIYPHPPQLAKTEAEKVIYDLVSKYKIEALAIGNGTAGRETYQWINGMKLDAEIFLINEDGASIYSASAIAREEFPKEDVTVRGAISIGRRLMDPLAELVKIDPKSIGVGQYQHDVNQTRLKEELSHTVSRAVNSVGINLNTASSHLLGYVSGLGPTTAKNITAFRSTIGQFKSRAELKKVPKLGPKAFEQCAGFLRIRESANQLDNTGVHPERYKLVQKMAKDQKLSVENLINNKVALEQIDLKQYIDNEVGMPTLKDIIAELNKPGLDPRGLAEKAEYNTGINSIEDITVGQELKGTVANLTKFGAFIDIGIKDSALLHISQIVDRYIADPAEVLSLTQKVTVRVLDVDRDRKRISVTMKDI